MEEGSSDIASTDTKRQKLAASNSPSAAEAALGAVVDGWYTELGPMWPGQGLSLKVDEVLFRGRSKLQDICVFRCEAYGTVLLLDGVIQCTDRDEFSYQEMLTHIPLSSLHDRPKSVLVIGGGDGGVLRELSRYGEIEELHIAEIDGMVPEVSKKYFPQMAVGFEDPRVQLHVCDGIKYVTDSKPSTYDAIIVDSSDPVGPAEVLFDKAFFVAMHRALKPGGVVCTQAESLWLHLDVIKALAGMCCEVFKGGSVSYAFTTIPTYPSGQIGMMICCKADGSDTPRNPRIPRHSVPETTDGLPPLRYYTAEVHAAAFALPRFANQALSGLLSFQ